MTITGFEIDFLPVGKNTSSGDAILFRYEEDGELNVILIDGGFQDTADTILKHMKEYYYPECENYSDMRIDHIVCSHPDQDHTGGIEKIMKECQVGALWINNPLDYISRDKLLDENNDNGFTESNADIVEELIKVAKDKGIPVDGPTQGKDIGPLRVCSPSEEFYKELVEGTLQRQTQVQANKTSIMEHIKKVIERVKAWWERDELYDYPETNFCNETSTILFGEFMNRECKILLTADAGIEALTRAEEYLRQNQNFEAGTLNFIQMPHHGSRQNVNSAILDVLLGKKTPRSSYFDRGISFASVAKAANEHPKKSVGNAFYTRGYKWAATKGVGMWYSEGSMPPRNWGPISFGGFEEYVEEL